jgi:hypothetical protein
LLHKAETGSGLSVQDNGRAAVFLFFMLFGHDPYKINAHIQLKTDQQNQ